MHIGSVQSVPVAHQLSDRCGWDIVEHYDYEQVETPQCNGKASETEDEQLVD